MEPPATRPGNGTARTPRGTVPTGRPGDPPALPAAESDGAHDVWRPVSGDVYAAAPHRRVSPDARLRRRRPDRPGPIAPEEPHPHPRDAQEATDTTLKPLNTKRRTTISVFDCVHPGAPTTHSTRETGVPPAMPHAPVRVVIADEQSLLRESLCALLDTEPGVEVVGQTGCAAELPSLVTRTRPDLVVLDVHMAPADNREALVNRLLHGVPACHVLVLSMLDQPRLVQSLLDLGIHGYLHKSIGYSTLIDAVRAQRETHTYQTVTLQTVTLPLHRAPLHPAGTDPSPRPELSAREVEVLTHTAAALSNRQIAVRLGIAEGTVKRHLSNIFDKLDAVSRLDAVNKAASMRFIRPGGTRGARQLHAAT